jgi:methyl-accepting chemotaxis protein
MRNKLLLAFLLLALAMVLIYEFLDRLLGRLVSGDDSVLQNWGWVAVIPVTLLLGLGAATILSRSFTRRLQELAGAARRVADGDLGVKVAVEGEDEVADLARSFRAMKDSLLNVVQEVHSACDRILASAQGLSATSEEMNATTQEIAATAQNIAQGAESQAEMVHRTTGITRSLAESIERIAGGAREARRAAEESGSKAAAGQELASRARETLAEVTERASKASSAVEGFQSQALEINKTVAVITNIAQQTHLLALNAAIEASRAGEQGRGFAVVAEEVGKLADHTRRFAEQISDLADQINAGSTGVLGAMEETRHSAHEGSEAVVQAATTLEEIVQSVESTRGRVEEISTLSVEQARGEEGLVKAIEEIAKIAEDNAAGTEEASAATEEQTASMEELSASAQDLARSSEKLRELISLFKVSG